ncbi:nucleotidyltransferase family protein [Agromyces bauzanensis]
MGDGGGTTARLRLSEAVPLATALAAHAAERAGVRILFLKGPIAEQQGLRPLHRSVDVDILVEPGGAEPLVGQLRDWGWHDRPGYRPLPLFGGHSATLIHDSWPCDYDVHYYWPGFAAAIPTVFEALWARRVQLPIAQRAVFAPSRPDALLVLVLHALRDAGTTRSTRDYPHLLEAARRFDVDELLALRSAAAELGATVTAAPFLADLGVDEAPSGDAREVAIWHMRGRPSSGTMAWFLELRQTPAFRRPAVLLQAVFPSPRTMRVLHPETGPGLLGLTAMWWRRIRTGFVSLPSAWAAMRSYRSNAARENERSSTTDVSV